MKLRILCPTCQSWTTTDRVAADAWPCAGCGASIPAAVPAGDPTAPLAACRVCGNHELYVQKDFPHWLGMGILLTAFVLFLGCQAQYLFYTAWAVLIGSLALDVLLYVLMGNVTVCYRCLTQYRGFPLPSAPQAFDLATGEKYRQEKLRKAASR